MRTILSTALALTGAIIWLAGAQIWTAVRYVQSCDFCERVSLR